MVVAKYERQLAQPVRLKVAFPLMIMLVGGNGKVRELPRGLPSHQSLPVWIGQPEQSVTVRAAGRHAEMPTW